ncbi:putative ATPase, partial [Gregarina niphandrodes]
MACGFWSRLWPRKKRGVEGEEEQLLPGPENTITVRSVVYEGSHAPVLNHNARRAKAEASPEETNRIPESVGNSKWDVGAWNNRVMTSQYTWWNLVPLNLLQQAVVPANFYFIVMSIMQLIPTISDSGGVPTYLVPLAFVMAVTMIKDAWEDIKRHRQDKEQNNRVTW